MEYPQNERRFGLNQEKNQYIPPHEFPRFTGPSVEAQPDVGPSPIRQELECQKIALNELGDLLGRFGVKLTIFISPNRVELAPTDENRKEIESPSEIRALIMANNRTIRKMTEMVSQVMDAVEF